MELSVLRLPALLALLALLSAGPCLCQNETEPEFQLDPSLEDVVPEIPGNVSTPTVPEAEQNISVLTEVFSFTPLLAAAGPVGSIPNTAERSSIEWQTWNYVLPNGAVSIYNGYVGRIDYVCKVACETGFYTPSKGNICYFPYGGKEYGFSPFQILVNKDNFQLLEWKEGSDGSVPKDSVKSCSDTDKYVAKNKYGLGKVHARHKAIFIPWDGKEYWYKTYQVLTVNEDIVSEHISNVRYKTDDLEITKYPPETMSKTKIINRACNTVKQSVTLSKTETEEQRWDTTYAFTLGVKTTMTVGVPLITSLGIELNAEVSFEVSKGTTHSQSYGHTVRVEHNVPPNHSCTVSMVGHKYGSDIPYTAQLSRTYRNGETRWTYITGVYRGVHIGDVQAVVDRCEPLPDAQLCSA